MLRLVRAQGRPAVDPVGAKPPSTQGAATTDGQGDSDADSLSGSEEQDDDEVEAQERDDGSARELMEEIAVGLKERSALSPILHRLLEHIHLASPMPVVNVVLNKVPVRIWKARQRCANSFAQAVSCRHLIRAQRRACSLGERSVCKSLPARS